MKKIIIAAILATMSASAAADTQLNVMKADRDLRYSIEKVLMVAGDKNAVLRSYTMTKKFEDNINPQIVTILNNTDTSCEVIAANVAAAIRVNFQPYAVNKLSINAIEDMIGKTAVYTMAQCYYLKD